MVRWDHQYTTKEGIISMYMKHETPAGEKWRMACLSCIWVGCRQAGALRKHPNTVRWYYHAPVIRDLPPHVPWPQNSFLISNTQKAAAEHINVFVGRKKKILKMRTSHEMNEKGMESSIPFKLRATCWMSPQQQPGQLHCFTAVRVASNQHCGKIVHI